MPEPTETFVSAEDLHDAFCDFGHRCLMGDMCDVRVSAEHVAEALNIRARELVDDGSRSEWGGCAACAVYGVDSAVIAHAHDGPRS